MDMGSSSMAMNVVSTAMSMASSATGAAAAAATSASSMDMGGMGMGMGGGKHACKISMLWNWYTIDSCFIASSWHVRSASAFGGSCIGVILLVMLLEALRRLTKEYDRYLLRNHIARNAAASTTPSSSDESSSSSSSSGGGAAPNKDGATVSERSIVRRAPGKFRPNVGQQAIRALLHMATFAVAYFVMLLAMYFNGYIIISIFIGSYLGAFVFNWETIDTSGERSDATTTTYCCG